MSKLIFLLLIALTSCRVGPEYERPVVETPCDWITNFEEQKSVCNLSWWEEFNDPVLNELIVTALEGNKDLKIAGARVSEFLGNYRVVRADLFPQIYGNAGYSRERFSETLTPLGPGVPNPFNTYSALLSGSWELDLFGQIRSATDAAWANLLASEQVRETIVSTLVTSVAAAYIDLLRLDLQLDISIHTTDSRKKTLDLFSSRFEAGVISKIELSQIESEYQSSKATIPVFLKLIAMQEYAIRELMGQNPSPIPNRGKLKNLKMPLIPDGLPSELVYRRPEIREAEQQLIAANAQIGVARAQYFPSITLTAQYGQASPALSNLWTGPSNMWNYFVPVSVPIFTAGKIGGAVLVAESLQQEALYNYEKQIQTAFREVEDAFIDFKMTGEQEQAEKLQVEALNNYARLGRMRYDEGYASYLEVLDAERSLFNAQLNYSDTQSNLYVAMIDIYRSLGGGWITEASRVPDSTVGTCEVGPN